MKIIQPRDWDRAKLKDVLNRFSSVRVGVFGDLGLDRYTMGRVERISPEAPVPVVTVTGQDKKLGLAANVAGNVKALGGLPRLMGMIGSDHIGETLLKLLREVEIPIDDIVVCQGLKTILKERVVSGHQQLLRVDYDDMGQTQETDFDQLFKNFEAAVEESDVVILEDYAKGLLSTELIGAISSFVKKESKYLFVDPNSKTNLKVYWGAAVLTPNKKEAEELTGIRIEDLASLKEVGNLLLKDTESKSVAITLGGDGICVFSTETPDGVLIPTCAREVFDVSGAGDTVVSVLAMSQGAGATSVDAAILANLAAGVVVSKRGTATVTQAEILNLMESVTEDLHSPILRA